MNTPRYVSPLRYPGGKARLAPHLSSLLDAQERRPARFVEAYAGGAGAGLALLFAGKIDHLHLNDLNPGLAAFWRTVTNADGARRLCDLIEDTPVTVEEWHHQRSIYDAASRASDLTLAFATFYLNRTNRSGILDARPIGGFEQNGKWGIDARFNKAGLIERIERIAERAELITVTEMDGVDLIEQLAPAMDAFFFIDPPYVVQGPRLYERAFTDADHARLAACLRQCASPWLLTYDHEGGARRHYPNHPTSLIRLPHTAAKHHLGEENLIYSTNTNTNTPGGITMTSLNTLDAASRIDALIRQDKHSHRLPSHVASIEELNEYSSFEDYLAQAVAEQIGDLMPSGEEVSEINEYVHKLLAAHTATYPILDEYARAVIDATHDEQAYGGLSVFATPERWPSLDDATIIRICDAAKARSGLPLTSAEARAWGATHLNHYLRTCHEARLTHAMTSGLTSALEVWEAASGQRPTSVFDMRDTSAIDEREDLIVAANKGVARLERAVDRYQTSDEEEAWDAHAEIIDAIEHVYAFPWGQGSARMLAQNAPEVPMSMFTGFAVYQPGERVRAALDELHHISGATTPLTLGAMTRRTHTDLYTLGHFLDGDVRSGGDLTSQSIRTWLVDRAAPAMRPHRPDTLPISTGAAQTAARQAPTRAQPAATRRTRTL